MKLARTILSLLLARFARSDAIFAAKAPTRGEFSGRATHPTGAVIPARAAHQLSVPRPVAVLIGSQLPL